MKQYKEDSSSTTLHHLRKSIDFKAFFSLFKEAGKELVIHDPLLLSSSVAFFTLFSLPPILIILTNIFGYIFKGEIFGKELSANLVHTFGENGANQILNIIQNFRSLNNDPWFTVLGSFFLILVGTTTFSIIHKALNQIWQVKQKPKNSLISFLKERGINLLIIIVSGILFLLSLLSDVLVSFFRELILERFPLMIIGINHIFSILIVTIWFAMIFKFLPNVRINWKPVWSGAILTGIMFTVGEYIIRELLVKSNLGTIYGAAGSIVLILLFIFYSSFILFYGASFIKAFATKYGYTVEPRHYAVEYEINELSKD